MKNQIENSTVCASHKLRVNSSWFYIRWKRPKKKPYHGCLGGFRLLGFIEISRHSREASENLAKRRGGLISLDITPHFWCSNQFHTEKMQKDFTLLLSPSRLPSCLKRETHWSSVKRARDRHPGGEILSLSDWLIDKRSCSDWLVFYEAGKFARPIRLPPAPGWVGALYW